MKLIIDIPGKVVTAIQNGEDYRYDIHTAIAQGVPYEERPQGEWILCEDSYFSKCSICGDILLNEECWNYCSNCGAYMRGDNNGKK